MNKYFLDHFDSVLIVINHKHPIKLLRAKILFLMIQFKPNLESS